MMNEADAIRDVQTVYPDSILVRRCPPGERATWRIMVGPTILGEGDEAHLAWRDAAKQLTKASPADIKLRTVQTSIEMLHHAQVLLEEAGYAVSANLIQAAKNNIWYQFKNEGLIDEEGNAPVSSFAVEIKKGKWP